MSVAAGVAGLAVKRAAVIGAGLMGAGIAAQFANAGIAVDLLDLPGGAGAPRNGPALAAIERQLKVGGFMHRDAVQLVRAGNTEDDLARLADAGWIIEAVVEKLDVKQALYERIEAVRRPGSIVSSNTSTICRATLVAGRSRAFARDFVITHFFNPPRLMRLVEIVSAPETDATILANVQEACETILGKTAIACRDTPGFIANRIGCYWMAVAAVEAIDRGLTPEEADAVHAAFGTPKTGVFGLFDLVGIDLMPQVWRSLMAALPADDGIQSWTLPDNAVFRALLGKGRFGRKAKAGFYRLTGDGARETVDFATGEYRSERPVAVGDLPGGGRDLVALFDAPGRFGDYARSVLSKVISYTALHGPEIAGDVAAIDAAMVLGYAWRDGPFRLADRIGAARLARGLDGEGRGVPPLLATAAAQGGFYGGEAGLPLSSAGTRVRPAAPRRLSLAAVKAKAPRLFGNDAASVWALGGGVACLEIHTKLNCLTAPVFDVIEEALARGGTGFAALVIGNDDPRAFSAGADLKLVAAAIDAGNWQAAERYVGRGQDLLLALKNARFPVVAAAHGLALGGGCELMLHACRVVAHAELHAGLPELKVGLIPAWGGATELLLRAGDGGPAPRGPAAAAARAFAAILAGTPSGSALEARDGGLLRADDLIVMNRDHVLDVAAATARAMAAGAYAPPQPAAIIVGGPSAKAGLMAAVHARHAAGALTDTDVALADALAAVLTGGTTGDPSRPMSEAELRALERAAAVELVRREATRERIAHMLATGKPLRN